MPYTRISPTAYGREAIFYAKGGDHKKGHNGNEERNILVGSVGMLPDSVISFEDQMQPYWNLASSRNKTQIQRIIGSFSERELDPKDPNSPLKAMAIAQEYFKEEYPDRQVAIFIQKDGKGGKIHFHGLVNNVSMTDHKGCTDDQRHFTHVRDTFNKVAERYIELDFGYTEKDKTTQHERTMRQKNAEGEHHYIWKDDLKDRIRTAMGECQSKDEFFGRLAENGVEATHHTSEKYGEYVTYELVDISGFDGKIPMNLKARSYKLGSDFGYEALEAQVEKNNTVPEVQPEPVKKHKERELTDEEKAEEKAIREKAEKFVKWAHDNGYNIWDGYKMNLDEYETANKNFESFLAEQERLKNMPPEPEIEEIQEELDESDESVFDENYVGEETENEEESDEPKRHVSGEDDEDEEEAELESEPDEEEDEEVLKLRQRNQMLQEQLLSDAEQLEQQAELQDDLDDLFGKDF